MSFPIAPLPEGPVDIVGDVHGELAALDTLLGLLGYDHAGRHPDGRHLVFVGDLVDRGPDSPGVVARVRPMVASGRATCVLGNHELNLLMDERKAGNRWFFGEDERWAPGQSYGSRLLTDDRERQAMLDFFAELPLGLARADLRVVHAEWNVAAFDLLEPLADAGALAAFADDQGRKVRARRDADPDYQAERVAWPSLRPVEPVPPLLERHGHWDAAEQNSQAHKVLTSGSERAKPTGQPPQHLGGKWRMAERVDWWQQPGVATPTVVGHYWRPWTGVTERRVRFPDSPTDWMGPDRHVFCVDYCVGMRYRKRGLAGDNTRLVALRWDEGPPRLISDRGERVACTRPPR